MWTKIADISSIWGKILVFSPTRIMIYKGMFYKSKYSILAKK